MGILISLELFTLFTEYINQAVIAPIIIITKGDNFSIVGTINIEVLIGGIHDIALPATIDKEANISIGFTTLLGSSILIKEGPEWALHITDILNRME